MITPPAYLSPSAINTFRQCPQKYKLSSIDRIPQPPTWHTHLGSFVHAVLEHLYGNDPHERGLDDARAIAAELWAAEGWQDRVEALEEKPGTVTDFKKAAFSCVQNLYGLEDPAETELDGREDEVNTSVEGVTMKGFIDRWVLNDDGSVTVADYKTGKLPNPRFTSERDEFFQMLAYSLMLEESAGLRPARVEIIYLAAKQRRHLDLEGTNHLDVARGTIVETREAIDGFAARGEFPCVTGPLCNWCHYKKTGDCPAFS